jgi:hypothetical protein
MTLELRHPGHHLWHLQAVSTPDAVRSYEHWNQRRYHVEIDGPLTLAAVRDAAGRLTEILRAQPPHDDMGPHDPRRTNA